jgi:hypothetical protein
MSNSISTLPLQWIPAQVGCHWSTAGGEFYISTYASGGPMPQPFPMSGYQLIQHREEIGRYPTLEEAQAAAEAIDTCDRCGKRSHSLSYVGRDGFDFLCLSCALFNPSKQATIA